MGADIFWRMNYETAVDDKVLGEKHAPIITLPDKMEPHKPAVVKVNVGGGKHPNENGHHIQWVELRMNDLYIGRAEFSPVVMAPEVEFTVMCPGHDTTISAVARCNLHGLWETKVPCKCCA